MNLPALLSILGLACYSGLFHIVITAPRSTRVRVRRLFLSTLTVMIGMQTTALVVSLAQSEEVAIAAYLALSAVFLVFGIAYVIFVHTLLRIEDGEGLFLGSIALSIGMLILIGVAPTRVIAGVYWNATTHFYLPRFGPLLPVIGIPYFLILGYIAVPLIQGYRDAHHPLTRHRIQYVLIGWCVLVAGSLANFIPFFKPYPIDLMANVINAGLIAAAIFRYQLLDIRPVIRRGLAYFIPTAVIAIGYFLTIFIVEKLLRRFVGYQVFLLSLIIAAVTAVAAEPLRKQAQLWVDRLFFGDTYDAHLMLQELSELATSILDIDRLTAMLLDRLTETMHVQWGALILREHESTKFRLVAEIGPNQQTSPVAFDLDPRLVRGLAKRKAAVTREELIDLPQFEALSARAREEINHTNARLFVPLVAQGTLVGILILGPKRAGIPYDPDERRTLTTLANQIAIAVENARLYREAQEEIAERKRAQMAVQAREVELERRTARLELLREIYESIPNAHDLTSIMETALRRTQTLLHCEGAGLVTLTIDACDVVAMVPETDNTPTASGTPTEARAVFRRLHEGDVTTIHNLETAPAPFRTLQSLGYRSALLVPVLHRQPQLIETLVLMADRPRAFGNAECEIGRDVAHSLALVIRHTEMRRAVQERTQALEQQLARVRLFNEITRTIIARYDLDSILQVVAQRLEDDFADLAAIGLSKGDRFAPDAKPPGHEISVAGSKVLHRLVSAVEIPALQRIRRGRIAYLDDLAGIEVSSFQQAVRELHVRSAVIVPLVVEETVFGVIVAARRERDAFSHAERDFLDGLGEHVALAIHQTRLHEEIEAAYQELRETQRAAMQQERLRALGEMASGIAHDINNAISPIPLYLRLIESKAQLAPGVKTYLGTIKIAIKDVEETVRRMRQFYRVRQEEDFIPVDVNRAARQAIELTRPRWRDLPQEKGITIDLHPDFQADLPAVMGDQAEIRQAVTNLIFNAVDAMPEGGTLTVRTRKGTDPSDGAILEVIDTGIGMDDEQQARAFEPFFSTKGERGSGLGLATVYGTMQRHGGRADVKSAPGEGTTIRLLFPSRPVVPADKADATQTPVPVLRILCIDDEPLLRKALQEVLENEGHNVTLADGGASGLDAFRTAHQSGTPFDVVITDLGMPDLDGRRVAEEIKEIASQTPVIMLTGWGYRMQVEDSMPSGVDLMLSKPPMIDKLTQALAQVTTGASPMLEVDL